MQRCCRYSDDLDSCPWKFKARILYLPRRTPSSVKGVDWIENKKARIVSSLLNLRVSVCTGGFAQLPWVLIPTLTYLLQLRAKVKSATPISYLRYAPTRPVSHLRYAPSTVSDFRYAPTRPLPNLRY
eukprot:1610-Rhodomonas_salina.2